MWTPVHVKPVPRITNLGQYWFRYFNILCHVCGSVTCLTASVPNIIIVNLFLIRCVSGARLGRLTAERVKLDWKRRERRRERRLLHHLHRWIAWNSYLSMHHPLRKRQYSHRNLCRLRRMTFKIMRRQTEVWTTPTLTTIRAAPSTIWNWKLSMIWRN